MSSSLAHSPWTSTISQPPIPYFLLPSFRPSFSPLFQSNPPLPNASGAGPNGPIRPRLCLPPLPHSPPLSNLSSSFPPTWGFISAAPIHPRCPLLALRRSVASPAVPDQLPAEPEPPSLPTLADLVAILPLLHDTPNSPILPPSPSPAGSALVLSPTPPHEAVAESRVPASRARRGAPALPRKRRAKRATNDGKEEPSTESEDGSEEGVRKRKGRRRATETPRDQHKRKYPCEVCGKLFARQVVSFLRLYQRRTSDFDLTPQTIREEDSPRELAPPLVLFLNTSETD